MADWINILAPVAGGIIDRLASGQRVKNSEQIFILLYSMAQDIKELRADFARFNGAIHSLNEVVNQLRVELAELRGRRTG